jgi:hypothetical protein
MQFRLSKILKQEKIRKEKTTYTSVLLLREENQARHVIEKET